MSWISRIRRDDIYAGTLVQNEMVLHNLFYTLDPWVLAGLVFRARGPGREGRYVFWRRFPDDLVFTVLMVTPPGLPHALLSDVDGLGTWTDLQDEWKNHEQYQPTTYNWESPPSDLETQMSLMRFLWAKDIGFGGLAASFSDHRMFGLKEDELVERFLPIFERYADYRLRRKLNDPRLRRQVGVIGQIKQRLYGKRTPPTVDPYAQVIGMPPPYYGGLPPKAPRTPGIDRDTVERYRKQRLREGYDYNPEEDA